MVAINSKSVGNLGEAKVLCKFVELRIPVYVPFGDNEKADLVADFGGKLQRIQVKTSIKAEDGKMIFDLTSTLTKNKKYIRRKYEDGEIDYFALYNVTRDKIYLVPYSEPKTVMFIRYEQPKNRQSKKVHLEEDYLIDNVLGKIDENYVTINEFVNCTVDEVVA
ncbi:hypothetical protein HNP86_001968 [Methanococcus maripaludis]|uniref:PD(D/E)XK endonuclease domain-containing protein n=1 Tax=Methanococcus maripaludis TaxID=39152 RepID=A0A7J9NVV0_METMI|nr:group I intron-associated PD-(D/E)XK endonuclease [Methanococcus maripaludis]MBA2851809.1 hypothetical protein [Methanococcus maripaludis]